MSNSLDELRDIEEARKWFWRDEGKESMVKERIRDALGEDAYSKYCGEGDSGLDRKERRYLEELIRPYVNKIYENEDC